jgi:hypothetical protein
VRARAPRCGVRKNGERELKAAPRKIAPSPFQPLPRIYPSPPPPLRSNPPHGPVPAHVSRGKGPYPVPFQFHLSPPCPLIDRSTAVPISSPKYPGARLARKGTSNLCHSCWWRGARARAGPGASGRGGEPPRPPPRIPTGPVVRVRAKCRNACAATAPRQMPPARLLRVVRHIFTPPPALLTPFPAVATTARISKGRPVC